MFKKITFICFCIVWVLKGFAQGDEPLISHLSWTQAGMRAIDERKIVMVAVGINPGDVKAKRLFSDERVKSFFSHHVIGIGLDMQAEEGRSFEPKLLMYPWPVYAFFMPFGDLLLTVTPEEVYRDHSLLLDKAKQALAIAEIKRKNSRTILFSERGLSEVLDLSRLENKPILIYGYKANNQSALLMEKNVFNLDSVADFYNKNFICIKSDTLSALDYPVFRFLNEKGKLLLQVTGRMSKDDMMLLGDSVLNRAKGVNFKTPDMDTLLQQAKEQNKWIFADCYVMNKRDNLVPERVIYRDPELADYLNRHFMNIRLNMNEEYGRELQDKYLNGATPSALFMDDSGIPQHWVVRELNEEELLKEAERSIAGKGLLQLIDLYQQGERDFFFITEYLRTLLNAGLLADAEEVALHFFSDKEMELLKKKEYWELFYNYIWDAHSMLFEYVYTHKADFEMLYGKNRVEEKMAKIWEAGAKSFVRQEGQAYVLDKKGLANYQKRMKQQKVANWKEIVLDTRMYAAEKTGDWSAYADIAEQKWSTGNISEAELYAWGMVINEYCKNPSVRFRAARWFYLELDKIAQREKNTGKVSHTVYKGYYKQLVDALVK